MTTKTATPRRRGYLLAEATIGGALMITVFAACLTLIADARTKTSFAARRQAAAGIASSTLDDLTSRATLVASSQALTDVDAVLLPGVRVGFTIVDVTTTFAANGPVGGTLFEVTVNVEHPVEAGPPGTITLRSLRRVK